MPEYHQIIDLSLVLVEGLRNAHLYLGVDFSSVVVLNVKGACSEILENEFSLNLVTYRYGHFSNQYIIHGKKNAIFYLL